MLCHSLLTVLHYIVSMIEVIVNKLIMFQRTVLRFISSGVYAAVL